MRPFLALIMAGIAALLDPASNVLESCYLHGQLLLFARFSIRPSEDLIGQRDSLGTQYISTIKFIARLNFH